MNRLPQVTCVGIMLLAAGGEVAGFGRGGGGYRAGGGYSASGSRSYSGERGSYSASGSRTAGGGERHGFSSFSGEGREGGSYSGSRSAEGYSGYGRGASSTYDRSYTDARGGSVSTSGERGASRSPYGGGAVGGSRNTSVTTAGGRMYSGERQGGAATGAYGRTVGGASGSFEGRAGAGGWETAFSGTRYTGNMSHYASVSGANGAHSTAYWSTGHMQARAGGVRTGFGYNDCFHPQWYAAHPGCWTAAGWAAGAAWAAPSYAAVSGYCGLNAAAAPDYDFGSTVVYQGDSVYVNGQPAATAQQYADQATAIAAQGQAAAPPPTDDWKPLGVFALVQGEETTSNTIFQLAVNKDGVIRGNFYDGISDTTTEVYGSVDRQTQRAAWTIGKKKDRVFDAGVFNLTQPECPCLVHLGSQSTTQMMLVRVEQPKGGADRAQP